METHAAERPQIETRRLDVLEMPAKLRDVRAAQIAQALDGSAVRVLPEHANEYRPIGASRGFERLNDRATPPIGIRSYEAGQQLGTSADAKRRPGVRYVSSQPPSQGRNKPGVARRIDGQPSFARFAVMCESQDSDFGAPYEGRACGPARLRCDELRLKFEALAATFPAHVDGERSRRGGFG
jgi:hypothetical protein